MKKLILLIAFSFLLAIIFPSTSYAAITLLHEFAGGTSDGSNPNNSVIISGSKLYGTTTIAGNYNGGTIFSVNTDGSGYTLLHEFSDGPDDGSLPQGYLNVSGSKLYGTAFSGGDDGLGTIFSMNTDGSGFTLLHEFAGGANDGSFVINSLLLSGNSLYGMTAAGGNDNKGTIFSMNTDGSGFTLLHEFAGGANDGSYPYDTVILSGGKFYGTTTTGGDNDLGTIFSMNTDGSGFTLLHEFAGGANDGNTPYDSLLISGGKLYGMTSIGGDSNKGTIFSMNTDGSGFTLLHEFAGGADDGSNPQGYLIISGSTLYGMTSIGGDSNKGTIFSMNTDGSGFTLLHEFAGGADDGSTTPAGSVLLSENTLYGTTYYGGDNDLGTVFSFSLPDIPTSGGSSPSGSSDPNVHAGWSSSVDAGPSFVGEPVIKSAESPQTLAVIPNDAITIDLSMNITAQSPIALATSTSNAVPVPWSQGQNVASDIYNFKAVSAFNGYPIAEADKPFIISLGYDLGKIKNIDPKKLKILYFDEKTKKWKQVSAPIVLDLSRHVISTTTTKFTYYTVAYKR